jgi:adenylate kinase family enzyme
MKGINFPIYKTKTGSRAFLLEDPKERQEYFQLKAGQAIKKLRKYLRENVFMGILLGPKNSGKGTYVKLFIEALGTDKVAHISVGDVVRSAHESLADNSKKDELVDFLKKRYRGFISIDKALDVILGRDTQTLLPTEIILALTEREIDKAGRKAIFVDGFPRNMDQVSYSLYFRSLMGYRDDPDFFVFIDVPESVIDERMKYRVICPQCRTPRNLKLLRTKEVGYDEKLSKFYLICDNPKCDRQRMVSKEGDDLGIEAIRNRIEGDGEVMRTLLGLEGVPQVFLRNSIPVALAKNSVDDYEITPAYNYELDKLSGGVKVTEEPWITNDDTGASSHSLLPAPIAVALINQVAEVLGL